jgi:hypothetical protein
MEGKYRAKIIMAHDVFISHSSLDKTTADAVCAVLESNGVRCWIAPRDVTPGMEWGECIIDAIEECRIMVLVFTTNANDSPQIRREVERAVNHSVAILPFRVEDILPGKALEYFIGNVHWLDAITTPMEIHLKSLADTVKMLLARMPARVAEAPETSAQYPTSIPSSVAAIPSVSPGAPSSASVRVAGTPFWRSLWFRAAMGGAVVLLIVLLVVLYFPRKPAVPQQSQTRTDWHNLDIETVKNAAKNGNAGAESDLGYRYYFGSGGVSLDYTQSLTWFRKSAEQGDPAGENGLGNIYLDGAGVPKDYSQALLWFRKSADLGFDAAENNLGYMYEFGRGTPQDYTQALAWFQKAADQNNDLALENLGYVYLEGHGVPKDIAMARKWFKAAADQGNEDAKKQLAALDAHN